MTTYGIREFKARISEILRSVEEGEEVIITRRGKPCGRLTPVPPSPEGKPSLRTLRDAFSYLPDASYEDFVELKAIWGPRLPDSGGAEGDRAD